MLWLFVCTGKLNVHISQQVIYPEDLQPHDDSILQDSSLREEITRTEDKEDDLVVKCLFCCYTVPGERAHLQVYSHMRTLHCFDFPEVVSGLSFYTQVKLVNYMRRKVNTITSLFLDMKNALMMAGICCDTYIYFIELDPKNKDWTGR